jgi:hypothetical protein
MRRYLAGDLDDEIEAKSYTERRIRQRIRERVRSAILDFSILVSYLEDRDVQQIFDFDDLSPEYRRALFSGIDDMITLFYVGTRDETPGFTRHLSRGVSAGERYLSSARRLLVDVSFDVDTDRMSDFDPKVTGSKIAQQDFDSLTEEEMRLFLELASTGGLLPPGQAASPEEGETEIDWEEFANRVEDVVRTGTPDADLPADMVERGVERDDEREMPGDNDSPNSRE